MAATLIGSLFNVEGLNLRQSNRQSEPVAVFIWTTIDASSIAPLNNFRKKSVLGSYEWAGLEYLEIVVRPLFARVSFCWTKYFSVSRFSAMQIKQNNNVKVRRKSDAQSIRCVVIIHMNMKWSRLTGVDMRMRLVISLSVRSEAYFHSTLQWSGVWRIGLLSTYCTVFR